MPNELTTKLEHSLPMTVDEIMAHVNLIETVMSRVMKPDMHYGNIPGCGKKPTLLKPGAEKLSMVFRLRPIIKEDSNDIKITYLANGHKDITVYCHVFNMGGVELATGVGSCSTLESKYRYRGGEKKPVLTTAGNQLPVPKEYWNLKKSGKIDEAQTLIGGPGYSAAKIDGIWTVCEIGEKMENPDIADVYNTVLKIAKKRAYVDGVLSATGASDTFTQDLEDLPDQNDKEIMPKPEPKPELVSKTEPEPKPYTPNVIEKLDIFSGETNKRKWTRYGITINGVVYGTFSETIYEVAKQLYETKSDFDFTWENGKDGKYNILTLEPIVVPTMEEPKDETQEHTDFIKQL